MQRLDKILANMGFGSRKEVKKLIKSGAVQIDGNITTDAESKVDPEKQAIKVNGTLINYRKYVYLIMNKPQGVITATEDSRSSTVLDLIDEEYLCFDISPVGRLDKNTEGLLILTNDGEMNHSLTSPKKGVDKVYYAEVSGRVNSKDIKLFKRGITLKDGYKALPADLEIIEESDISKIKVTVREGKYHQVRRMFEAVSKKVIFLKRLSMGSLELDEDLEPGEYRELTEREIEELKSLC
ncbi:MAG: pseudouridine synthase [Lutispora sp.]|nr:pseudouridine synthase [Lutispora sp.]